MFSYFCITLTLARRYYTAQGRVPKKAKPEAYKFRFTCPTYEEDDPYKAEVKTLFDSGDYCPEVIMPKNLLKDNQAMYPLKYCIYISM